MSFGFGVGDIFKGAELTVDLVRILSSSQGAAVAYQDAIRELNEMEKAFVDVSKVIQMGNRGDIPTSTVQSITHMAMSAMNTIAAFLAQARKYQEVFRKSGKGARGMQATWVKLG